MVFLLGLLVTITSSDQKERGLEEEKKPLLPSVEKLRMPTVVIPLTFGVTDYKPVPFSLLMSASKLLEG